MSDRFNSGRRGTGFDVDDEVHYPTRPVDKDKAEQELIVNIKKATSPEETAPKQKHVRSMLLLRYLLARSNSLILTVCRGYRIHVGLSLLNFFLERTSGSAHLGR